MNRDECDAWRLIDSISVEDIINGSSALYVQYLPPSLRASFQDCCVIPLGKIEENPSYGGGWKLLLLLPCMILRPNAKGKAGVWEIKAIHQRFLHFYWRELIQLQRKKTVHHFGSEDMERKRKSAFGLIRCGELSRTARILTSGGLAPPTDDIVQTSCSSSKFGGTTVERYPASAVEETCTRRFNQEGTKRFCSGAIRMAL